MKMESYIEGIYIYIYIYFYYILILNNILNK